MKAAVRAAGLEARFQVDSAAVSREEIGNPIYPPAQRQPRVHGASEKRRAGQPV